MNPSGFEYNYNAYLYCHNDQTLQVLAQGLVFTIAQNGESGMPAIASCLDTLPFMRSKVSESLW